MEDLDNDASSYNSSNSEDSILYSAYNHQSHTAATNDQLNKSIYNNQVIVSSVLTVGNSNYARWLSSQ